MNAETEQLKQKKRELETRLQKIKNDISSGLDANASEQAIQLENRDVLLEIRRVTEEELAAINRKLSAGGFAGSQSPD